MRLIDVKRLKSQLRYYLSQKIGLLPLWISVEERLPAEGNEVLIYNGNAGKRYTDVWMLLYDEDGPYWEDTVGYQYGVDEATHWMPLPEPPKEVLS